MIGAIAGDIIGSVYERTPVKSKEFPLFQNASVFTDDTVLTIAVASAILKQQDYAASLQLFGRQYPNAGYGAAFFQWLSSAGSAPYNSWGNGSAMRVSPVGFAFDTRDKVLAEAQKSAEVTHNHPEGIKGAQATALTIFMARMGESKAEIKKEISTHFSYDLNQDLDEIRPQYSFDVSCQGSVPASIIAFLSSTDYEDAIRNAISLGGDSDTMACIAGGIAQAYYKKIPEEIVEQVRQKLPESFWQITCEFNSRFGLPVHKIQEH